MFSEPIHDSNGSITGSNDSINRDISNKKFLILNLIKANSKITRKKISQELSISVRTVDRIIEVLKNDDVIERVGSNKTGHWIVR